MAAVVLTSSAALAQGGLERRPNAPYIGGVGGVSFVSKAELTHAGGSEVPGDNAFHFDPGFFGGLTLGYRFEPFRVEVEGSYRNSSIDRFDLAGVGRVGTDGRLTNSSVMGNVYLDWPIHDRVDLYVGAGMGMTRARMRASVDETVAALDFNDTDTVFAYQVMTGAAYYVKENIRLHGGYRFFRHRSLDFDDGIEVRAPASHGVEVGVSFFF